MPAVYDAPAYSIMILDIVLTTAALAGRILSRMIMKAGPATDDYLAYLAYVGLPSTAQSKNLYADYQQLANLGLLVSGLLLTTSGALNLEKVTKQSEQERHFTRSAYNSLAVLYVFSITFVKLSIIFMYRRTFTMLTTWFRYAWYFTFTLTLLWTATCITLLALQTSGNLPKSGFSRLGISITGVVNAFTDVLILGLPALMVSRMRLARKQKVALMSIFLIGGMLVSSRVVQFPNTNFHRPVHQ
jgi:cytochrome bd-type quinol oxidase subunit 2